MKERHHSSFSLVLIALLVFVVGHSGRSIGEEKLPRVAAVCAAPILSPPNHVIVAGGGPGSVTVTIDAGCPWTATSSTPWITITGGSPGDGNGTVSYQVNANPGPNPRRGTVMIAGKIFTVSQRSPLPSPCTIAFTAPSVTTAAAGGPRTLAITASTATCAWSAKSHVSWLTLTSGGTGTGNGTLHYTVAANGSQTSSRAGRISVNGKRFTVTQNPTQLPPDPGTVAPPVDQSVATTVAAATDFLYTGANPIQTGVTPGTIDPKRTAVIRGKVLDKNNSPLSGVFLSILNHPEFGQTVSRVDGGFDLAVNGGGVLTVNYEKPGFLPSRRQVNVPWQDFVFTPDVVLIALDTNVTTVNLTSPTMTVARGGMVTDSDGTRRATILVPTGTTAQMVMPNGTTQPITTLNVRATEYTVGPNGPNAMPAPLPPTSAYTYAVEYSADEALAAGAQSVTFNQPLFHYNENFLNFPAGTIVPSGVYDRLLGQWIPSTSGRVVKILTITAGAANLDVNGNGQPATTAEYAALGITTAERQRLATLYTANQSLWRVPIIHFSPWDSNWPYGPPPDAEPPGGGPPSDGDDPPDDEDECDGCIIGVQGQTLGEELNLVGSPFKLRYSSDRKLGRVAARSLNIPLSGATIPASLKRIELTVTISGRAFTQSFPAQINQNTIFTWDGLDAYGRAMQGKQTATVTVGNVYDGSYQRAERFGYNGNGIPITGDPARQEITLSQVSHRQLGAFDDRALALGGWSLDVHHFYDPTDHTLYEGNGSRRSVQTINATITTVAGNGATGFTGDNVQATSTSFFFPFDATVAPNGELYIADSENRRVRKVDLDGIVTTIVGTGASCTPTLPCGDGGQAINAQVNFPTSVALSPDNSLYIYDAAAARIRKVAPNGVITAAVGTGQSCADPTSGCGDGGPATQARLSFTPNVCCSPNNTVAADGTLYLTDSGNRRVRRVGTDGIITTIAGNGRTAAMGGCTVVGGSPVVAANACLGEPFALTAVADGSVYFTDVALHQIFRVTADGFIRVVAGDGVCGNTGDGGAAVAARLCKPEGITRGPDGTLYFSDWNNARIRRIDTNGIITNYVGTGVLGFSGDGGPATAARIRQSIGVAIGPDGALYIGEANNHRIRKVFPPLPGFNDSDIAVPSTDGNELFKFNSAGRHLQTVNTLTNAVKYTFGYDSAGRLITVTDGDNNITTIQRNGSGIPTGILSPYNQLTTFTLDANGYFATITNPASEQHQFTYTSGGLLTLKRDPRNNQNTFTYDTLGRLTRDDDAATGFQTLARVETGPDYTVTRNTALNRTSTFQVQQLTNSDQQRTNTLSSGLQELLLERQNGTSTSTAPDGTVTNETLGPDPRWKLQAPLTTSTTIATPGGVNLATTLNRSLNLSNPADPLSLVSLDDTLAINGRNYTSNFTAATRTFVDTTPVGRQTQTVIDTQGRATSQQFATLDPASYTYDPRGRISTAIFGTGINARTFTYDYNTAGFLAAQTDSLDRVTGFSYDTAGRVTQQTLPDSRIVTFGYDTSGNPTSLTPPGRPAHTLDYNALNLLTSYMPPTVAGTGATQFAYNLDRQLSTITRPDALTINFAYDTAGRLQTLTVPNGAYGLSYSGTTGNLIGITAPGDVGLSFAYDGFLPTLTTWTGAVAGTVGQTFDNNFRMTSQSINGANTVNFTYDNDSLPTGVGGLTITRNAQNGLITGKALGSVTDAWGYNNLAELTSYSAQFNATPLYATNFTRDKLGRLTQKVETIGGVTNTIDYAYDLAGRLSTVKLNNITVSTYTYDSNSNRASYNGTVTGSYDAQDRMTAYGAATYTYTANGELATKTVAAQTTNYSYDVIGSLRTVTLPDTTQIEYVIDGRNRRIGKKVNGTLTQGWLYQDQLEPVVELDGGGNVVSRFVYGTRTHTPDYMVKGGVTYRILTDHLGSVRLVVNAATGAIAQRLDYDEFGVVTLDTVPGFQPFGFVGGLYDTQTKLVRFGARDYDAETGRWTAKDPILFAGRDTNLYGYVMSDPINAIDYYGADPVSTAGGVAGGLIDPITGASYDALTNLIKDADRIITDNTRLLNSLKKKKNKKACDLEAIKRLEDQIARAQANKKNYIEGRLRIIWISRAYHNTTDMWDPVGWYKQYQRGEFTPLPSW